MKVLSLFSGVGGFDLGLEAAGMETVFQCEWDKHATNILERHWPHVPRWGDISTLTGKHILNHAPVIDVVAWGSPCQDLSVAGKRAGLEGARSGLFHEGVRIIKELRKETNNEYPRISIWENVYGALNSNRGADFGVILNEMAEAGALVQEWRVLDAQYFGVPQRRRRVFLISIFDTATATRCPNPLLPVSEGVQWHPATSHTTRQTTPGTVANCLRVGSGVGERGDGSDNLVVTPASFGSGSFGGWTATDTAITLSQRDYKGSMTLAVEQSRLLGSEIVGSLNAVDYKWPQNQQLDENKFIVEPYVKSKRPQTATDDETWVADQPNPTLNAFDQGDTRTTTVIVEDPVLMRQREGKPGGGKGPLLSNDKSLTLSGSNDQTLFTPIGFSHTQGLSAQPSEDAWPTLRTEGNGMAVAYDEYNDTIGGEVHHALRAGTKQSTGVMTTMAVRRLTPLECERLMGWPDDWTAGQSDTHRYKQCGNGVASPVAQWIAQQLLKLNTP
jgi:DNA (cytosine-5)-methyltransferase 1